jgi:hypothetical protein
MGPKNGGLLSYGFPKNIPATDSVAGVAICTISLFKNLRFEFPLLLKISHRAIGDTDKNKRKDNQRELLPAQIKSVTQVHLAQPRGVTAIMLICPIFGAKAFINTFLS